MKSRLIVALVVFTGLISVLTLLGVFNSMTDIAQAASNLTVCHQGPPTCQYSSIQAAVDAATEGDTIMVASGTYSEISEFGQFKQIVYLSKTVTLRGGYLPGLWENPDPKANPTILDAQGQGRVIYITGYISPTIEYFHVRGGDATGLGGGPTVAYDGTGGGIYVDQSAAAFYMNDIYSNTASRTGWGNGGGVFLNLSPAVFMSNHVFSNTASSMDSGQGEGGGFFLWNSAATLTRNDINGNVGSSGLDARGYGGGLYLALSDATVVGNRIAKNTANNRTTFALGPVGFGGGVFVGSASADLVNNLVIQNTASYLYKGGGGGIYLEDDSSTMINNVVNYNFSGATPDSYGAGIVLDSYSTTDLLHTTINDNQGGDGSGVYISAYSSANLTNTILVSHTIGVYVDGDSGTMFNGVLWYDNGINKSGAGAMVANNEVFGNPRFDVDGYHLRWLSAARNTGVDSSIPKDIDNELRPYGTEYDLGADELQIVWANLDQFTGGRMIYANEPGMTITVDVPPGAVNALTTLTCIPLEKAGDNPPSNLTFAGRSFTLDAYRGSNWLDGFVFDKPVILTVYYKDEHVAGIDENSLVINFWDGSDWVDGSDTCKPSSSYTRDPALNKLSVPICHLSRWDMLGAQLGGIKLYLPITMRQ